MRTGFTVLLLASVLLLARGGLVDEVDEALSHQVRDIAQGDEEIQEALSEVKRSLLDAFSVALEEQENALSSRKRGVESDEDIVNRSVAKLEEDIDRRALRFATRGLFDDFKSGLGDLVGKGAKMLGNTLKKGAMNAMRQGTNALDRTMNKGTDKLFGKGCKKNGRRRGKKCKGRRKGKGRKGKGKGRKGKGKGRKNRNKKKGQDVANDEPTVAATGPV